MAERSAVVGRQQPANRCPIGKGRIERQRLSMERERDVHVAQTRAGFDRRHQAAGGLTGRFLPAPASVG